MKQLFIFIALSLFLGSTHGLPRESIGETEDFTGGFRDDLQKEMAVEDMAVEDMAVKDMAVGPCKIHFSD